MWVSEPHQDFRLGRKIKNVCKSLFRKELASLVRFIKNIKILDVSRYDSNIQKKRFV